MLGRSALIRVRVRDCLSWKGLALANGCSLQRATGGLFFLSELANISATKKLGAWLGDEALNSIFGHSRAVIMLSEAQNSGDYLMQSR